MVSNIGGGIRGVETATREHLFSVHLSIVDPISITEGSIARQGIAESARLASRTARQSSLPAPS